MNIPRGLAALPLVASLAGAPGCAGDKDCKIDSGDTTEQVDTSALDEAMDNLRWAARNNGGEPPYAEETFDVSPRFEWNGSGHEATVQVRGQSDVVLDPEEEDMQGLLIGGVRGAQSVEDFLWDAVEVGSVAWEQAENHTVVSTDAIDSELTDALEMTFVICGDECRVVIGFLPEGSEDESFGAEFSINEEGAELIE